MPALLDVYSLGQKCGKMQHQLIHHLTVSGVRQRVLRLC